MTHSQSIMLQKPARIKRMLVSPAGLTFFILVGIVILAILAAGGDPLSLVRIGTRFSQGDPNGTEGYDGQFVYYIARNPNPADVAVLIDVPAYRYQRILLPLLARFLSLGQIAWIPWILPLIGILAQTAGTAAVAMLLEKWRVNRWYALVYGLWVGLTISILADLPEPLAYALIAGALLAHFEKRRWWALILYALALFAKEVTILFILGHLAADLYHRRWRDATSLVLVALLPFALFQGWLWLVFGQPGLSSGGAMATSFELIPFMGLLRIWSYSPAYFWAMLVVFGPAIVLPTIWGVWQTLKSWIKGDRNVIVFSVAVNAVAIAFMPFSTFRETGGVLRFSCGLMLALLLYIAQNRMKRPLLYSLVWLALNAFLIKS